MTAVQCCNGFAARCWAAFPVFRNAGIEACFYPYIGLTHTIRRKGSKWMVRISDHCRFAPRPVLEAIVMILGSKIVRRRPPRKFLEAYESFRNDPMVVESVRERRRLKGRKHIASDAGKILFSGRNLQGNESAGFSTTRWKSGKLAGGSARDGRGWATMIRSTIRLP